MGNSKDRFRVSTIRLLIAIAVFAAACVLTWTFVLSRAVFAAFIGGLSAVIALHAEERHIRPLFRMFLTCGVGLLIGLVFCPAVHPPYQPGDEYRYMLLGAIGGWIVGLFYDGILAFSADTRDETKSTGFDEEPSRGDV